MFIDVNDRPIRDENPCFKCVKPKRFPGCHGKCKDHEIWKAEVERVNKNRREAAAKRDIGRKQ